MLNKDLIKFTQIRVIPRWFGKATLFALGEEGLIYVCEFKGAEQSKEWKIVGAVKTEVFHNVLERLKQKPGK